MKNDSGRTKYVIVLYAMDVHPAFLKCHVVHTTTGESFNDFQKGIIKKKTYPGRTARFNNNYFRFSVIDTIIEPNNTVSTIIHKLKKLNKKNIKAFCKQFHIHYGRCKTQTTRTHTHIRT